MSNTRNLISDDGITRVYEVRDGSGKPIGKDAEAIPTPAQVNANDLRTKGLAFLALPSPTVAQTTKVVRALVMLQLQALDDITGT